MIEKSNSETRYILVNLIIKTIPQRERNKILTNLLNHKFSIYISKSYSHLILN